jgi:hypothetical protein
LRLSYDEVGPCVIQAFLCLPNSKSGFYSFNSCLSLTRAAFLADHLMECVESHAYHTYDDFLANFGEKLKTKPAPEVAVKYYTSGDLYMFGELIDLAFLSANWVQRSVLAMRPTFFWY